MKTTRLLLQMLLVVAVIFIVTQSDAKAEVFVYDAEGEFLGIFNGNDQMSADIYVPSAEMSVFISYLNGDVDYPGRSTPSLYYEGDNCTGKSHLMPDASYYIYKVVDKYYSGEKVAPVDTAVNSRTMFESCTQLTRTLYYDLVPAQEFILPFTLPVALPLRLEYKPAHPGKR